MLTIFADNTMILGSIADRQDMPVVATSTITRGLERLAVHVLRAVVPVVGVYVHVRCAAPAAASCQSFSSIKRWQPSLGGNMPLGTGLPVGTGLHLRNQMAG